MKLLRTAALAGVGAAQAQDNLTELSAAEAARQIRAGKLKSEDLVKALADAIEKRKDLNAFISFDRERALKAARAADAAAAKKQFKGPLHGVPLVVKDNIHVAGFANSAGTPALKDFRPKANAPVADRLVKAGAIVLGKTNMHELAFGITSNNAEFGPARNAYDPARIAGGSSGGTANAVAARLAPAGLGSDTGGSVRIPAALNGISGLRPTLKRYPQAGITPIAHTRDTAGPMARTVEDLVLLDGVISRAKDKVAPARLKGLRIGVEKAYFFKGIDAETEKLTLAALAFPTTPLPAAPIGEDETTKLNGKDVPTFPTFIQNTDPGSNAGIPGLTVPIGRTQAGLPLGLELDGPAGSDRKLLAIGLSLEKLFGRLPAP